MSNKSTIKLLIAFNDPNLEPEERDEQAQVLLTELQQADEVEVPRTGQQKQWCVQQLARGNCLEPIHSSSMSSRHAWATGGHGPLPGMGKHQPL
ncbi:MAG: hypothetical protein ACKO8H_25680 [Microcystis panniformis]